jgi:hypothetical protein
MRTEVRPAGTGPRGALVPDEEKQRTLRTIAELHRSGSTLQRIVAPLNAEGYKPRCANKWHHGNRDPLSNGQ